MSGSRKIVPFLWFDGRAEEAARFYVSVFDDSAIQEITRHTAFSAGALGQAEGAVMTVVFRIGGQEFVALEGGPMFSFTPAISFFVNCADVAEAERLFGRLIEGGTVLMPLGAYPFSPGYGWVQDRYGVSWQVNAGARRQKIAPCLMFTGEQSGRAEEAMHAYASIFPGSSVENVWRYDTGEEPDTAGSVKHAIFMLGGEEMRALDSGLDHGFTFSEAISLQVLCDDQGEIDHFWEHLGAGEKAEAGHCGWLKDDFGVSWQVVPRILPEMLRDPDPHRVNTVMQAFFQMRKFDIGTLTQAFEDGVAR